MTGWVRPGSEQRIAAAGGESEEDVLSGHPTYLAAKANGDHSLSGTRRTAEDVYARVPPPDPCATVNAGLREAQFPAVQVDAPR